MRHLQRLLLALPLLLLAFGMAAGCHSTIPSLLLTIEDPVGLQPTQLRVTVSTHDVENHHVTRPETPNGALASPQTLRLFMPDEAIGRQVDLWVEALRNGEVIGSAVTVTVLKALEDTDIHMALVPGIGRPGGPGGPGEPEVCDATSCPFGCCRDNVCVEGDFLACGVAGGACDACDATSTDQCVEGSCRCGGDLPCPVGYACEEGACRPDGEGQSCTSNAQCTNRPGQCYEEQGVCGEQGKCVYPFKPSTEPCNDGDSCTEPDRCDGSGVCRSTPKVCEGPTGQCLADSGQCMNGVCRYDPVQAGTTCTDNNQCTDGDACTATGTCQGTPKNCPDHSNVCMANLGCDETTGECRYGPKNNGTQCGTNNACVSNLCQSGQCVTTQKVTCTQTSDSCRAQTGTCDTDTGVCNYAVISGTCDSGDACRVNTTCQSNGTCGGGSPKSCPAPPNTQCWNQPSCNSATGECTQNRKPVGTHCGTNNACETNTCNAAGNCVRTQTTCNNPPNTACYPASVACHPTNGCVWQPDVGRSCTLPNLCRVNGTCQANGTCGGGTPKTCPAPPNTQCWDAPTCDQSTGNCTQNRKPINTPCGGSDVCSASTCDGAGNCRPPSTDGVLCDHENCMRCSGGSCQSYCGIDEKCCNRVCRPWDFPCIVQ